MAIMTLNVSLLRLWHSRNREVVLIGMALLIFAFSVSSVEGKRRRTVFHPPLKIIEVIPNPSSLEIGSGELELSIVVELPVNLREANVLEVTSVITSASKRSVRFLSHRAPIHPQPDLHGKQRITVSLLWDGTDQTQQVIDPGTYHYEVRAKLMVDKGEGPRTRTVSRRSRGTIKVIPPEEKALIEKQEGLTTPKGSKEIQLDVQKEEEDNIDPAQYGELGDLAEEEGNQTQEPTPEPSNPQEEKLEEPKDGLGVHQEG